MKPRPNEPCPCGSGRKYKKCHGAAARHAHSPIPQPSAADWLTRGDQLQATGRLEEAETCYQQALRVAPGDAQSWVALGDLAERAGDIETARACYTRLVELHPGHVRGHFVLGNIHARALDFEQARQHYLRALELRPDLPGAWLNLGNVEKYLGQFHQAIACYRRDVELEPDAGVRARRHGNLLFALHYDESLDHGALFQAHVDWAERHARAFYPRAPIWSGSRDPDRTLRIGYLSGSFDGRILGHFLLNVLARHDAGQFQISAYSSTLGEDEYTNRLRAQCAHWIDIAKLDDAAAAERIRADAIDILVDLDGHTPAGRPLLIARRPAPIQVEWLDWLDTTGMAVVDYLLTDPYTTPPDSPQRFAETPYRLPHSRFCYTPPEYAPPVSAPPCQAGKPLTFGSFNRQDKLTPELIALWAEILRAAPGSRLVLKNRALQAPAIEQAVLRRFKQSGIDPARVELRGPSPHDAMLAEYADIDIALDTFPYNGGLTSCECLWMGVPIVALEGQRMISRQTAAMLSLLGMRDWLAATPAEYVRLAVDKSRDPAALARLRAEIRPRMAASPLCDAPRFAKDLENAYREMWRSYCAS